ncbi:MAG: type I methionyl aminopeptidase [Planctomycetia bacterium]|nr:type I methionyl aminopeptidase [Planctomycetia bacterium]
MAIILKSEAEIEKMRLPGLVVAETVEALKEMAKPGLQTREFEEEAKRIFDAKGAMSLFKGHHPRGAACPYPGIICVSVNEELVHGIPGTKRLEEGDIVSFDVGVTLGGWCADAARTVTVGDVDADVGRLRRVTEELLQIALESMKPQVLWSSVAAEMERHAAGEGFSIVTQFVGHGIGEKMWEEPQIPNYVSQQLIERDILLQKGMTLAVEPMVNMGGPEVRIEPDGWTVVTVDGKPSAHFEDTIAIGDNGAVALTRVER